MNQITANLKSMRLTAIDCIRVDHGIFMANADGGEGKST